MNRRVAAALLLLSVLAGGPQQHVRAYSTGAPESNETCTTLLPSHRNTAPQTGPSPFGISVAQGARDAPLNVTITSRQGFLFKGFIVQARAADRLAPIGSFVVLDSNNTQAIPCFGGVNSTVTHTSPKEKDSITFQWTSPADFHGNVVFNATVVQDYTTYWQDLTAKALIGEPTKTGSTAGISTTQPPLTTQRTSTTNAPVTMKPAVNYRALSPIFDECGTAKGCFGTPENCESQGTCTLMMSSLEKGDKYVFELMASGANVKYVAIGLSDNQIMDSDLVMECVIMPTSEIRLFQSLNSPAPSKGNTRIQTNGGLEMLSSSYVDDVLYCQFERDFNSTVNDVVYNLRNTEYYVLLATGSLLKNDGEGGVNYHNINQVYSSQKGFLSEESGFALASKLLLRLHGAFMIGAWIGAASIGIVLARYFKQTWPGSQLCGKDQWFAWHRILMVLVWSLTIAAFIIIFVELKSWASSAKNHAILGIITTALAFFQPIGAIFRPSPDSSKRPIFNWLHWFFGNSAHILGIVTIFLAGQLAKAELPKWWIWIMVGYVAFHVLMHLMFSVAGCVSERQSSKRVNSFPLKEMSNSRTPLSSAENRQEAPHSCFRKFLLALYIFGILVITIALIVITVLAPIEENIQAYISANRSV